MKQVAPEVQEVCLLLLQITVMALYLEYSVIQICGIRPVLGHVETFSKELRLLIRGNIIFFGSSFYLSYFRFPIQSKVLIKNIKSVFIKSLSVSLCSDGRPCVPERATDVFETDCSICVS